MAREADTHPCFSCRLPDCDDGSRWCGLCRAYNDYQATRRRGEQPDDMMRERYVNAFRELYLPRRLPNGKFIPVEEAA